MAVEMSLEPPRGPAGRATPFEVHLAVFQGPFELLLSLISKHRLDVTEVALAEVTDEFVAHLRAANSLDLEQATNFLVVAATLLDLKAARLLPSAQVDDDEDLALLEARDLLFARLLQYRAYKQVAPWLSERFAQEARWTPRDVGFPQELSAALPQVVLGIGAGGLAEMAARVLSPRPAQLIDVDHVHAPRINLREHMAVLSERLTALGVASFRALCADCRETIEIVARFLGVLELFREGRVSFDQVVALGDLQVRWLSSPGQEPGAPVNAHQGEFEEKGPA